MPTLSLISSASLSGNTEKLFLRLSVWLDEVFLIPKITTFLAKSLSKLHKPPPSEAILQPLQMNLPPNEQFFVLKSLLGLCGQLFISETMGQFKIKVLYNEEEFCCAKAELLDFNIT